jgi:hypothetical protein
MHSQESPFGTFSECNSDLEHYPNRPQESDAGLSLRVSSPNHNSTYRDGGFTQPSRPRSEPSDSLESEKLSLGWQAVQINADERTDGFPSITLFQRLLGFYRESRVLTKGLVLYCPNPAPPHMSLVLLEVMQATEILDEALAAKYLTPFYALKDWSSINNLIDHLPCVRLD